HMVYHIGELDAETIQLMTVRLSGVRLRSFCDIIRRCRIDQCSAGQASDQDERSQAIEPELQVAGFHADRDTSKSTSQRTGANLELDHGSIVLWSGCYLRKLICADQLRA